MICLCVYENNPVKTCKVYIMFFMLVMLQILDTYMYLTVTTQDAKGPGIVIAHPGQDVELLCTVAIPIPSTIDYELYRATWIINHIFYEINSLNNDILPGYSANFLNNNLMVENIVMNDHRNDSNYLCAIVTLGTTTIVDISDPTFLYVAGKCL